MQWLRHGNISNAAADALRTRGDTVHEMTETELPANAPLAEILKAARDKHWDIITADAKLARAPLDLNLWLHRSIVYLELEGGEVEQDDAVGRLFERYKRLAPNRLYTVTEKRVKIRQLPEKK